ncbi:MAG: nucleotidyltransferase domain-containing protein [Betaproteobacteria bacterium]|nr:nucleotidyltransferase domain-containing protein [Betaproteobacteria bacterium]
MNGIGELTLKARDRAAIAEAVAVLRSRFAAESVTLYGSKANGTDDAESDIDLLVLTSRVLGWRERTQLTEALFEISLAHGVIISPLIVPALEWKEGRISVLPIHDVIASSGVPL